MIVSDRRLCAVLVDVPDTRSRWRRFVDGVDWRGYGAAALVGLCLYGQVLVFAWVLK